MRQTMKLVRVLALLAASILLFARHAEAKTEASAEDGKQRIPWTTSRVMGTPEPPPPYVTQRVFPKLQFKEPTEMAFIPGTKWALVIEREAKIHAFEQKAEASATSLVADLQKLPGRANESYSIAFHPGFLTNRFVYISLYSRNPMPPTMRVSRFVLPDANPPRLDLASEVELVRWPSDGHNGCSLAFGKDGYLYISSGDGDAPAPPDPRRTGQRLDDLLSSLLRIDVDHPENGKPYRIPADNPFPNTPGIRPEIWAYGFRNPWKICVDPRDGAVWVADVGWEAWELVFRVDKGGFNGGWSAVEGPHPVNTSWERGPTPITSPVISHPHTEAASITGGFVYRGSRLPELRDSYIYGDWETGKIWELGFENGAVTKRRELTDTPFRIIGFAEDNNRELYVVDYAGGIYELAPSSTTAASQHFPRKLSDTGLFAATADYQLAPGVLPYSIVAPMWADHAEADFAVALPGETKIGVQDRLLAFPTNTVFVRTFTMDMEKGNPATRRRLETQLLHFDGYDWNGYTYQWNDAQTDADLVGKDGADLPLAVKDSDAPNGIRQQVWRIHSRTECMRCHMNRFGFVNSFIPQQLAQPFAPGKRADQKPATNAVSQYEAFVRLKITPEYPRQDRSFTLAPPHDASASLNDRARSWMHANCGHCHREAANGAVMMYLHAEMPLDKTLTVGHKPNRGTFGIPNAELIAAGDPYRSTILYRTLTPGAGRMPIIGSTMVDEAGTRLLRDWIKAQRPGKEGTAASGAKLEDTVARICRDLEHGDTSAAATLAELLKTTGGAMALEFAAADSSLAAPVREKLVAQATASSLPAARDLFERFLPVEQRRKVLGASIEPASILSRTGDIERGRTVFLSETGAQCATCHRVAGEGRDYGPDLSRIGAKYDRAALLDHILHPNKSVEPQWKARGIETKDGDSWTGFLQSSPSEQLILKIADGSTVKFEKSKIASVAIQEASIMPEGLLQNMTAQEAADLIEYLARLQ